MLQELARQAQEPTRVVRINPQQSIRRKRAYGLVELREDHRRRGHFEHRESRRRYVKTVAPLEAPGNSFIIGFLLRRRRHAEVEVAASIRRGTEHRVFAIHDEASRRRRQPSHGSARPAVNATTPRGSTVEQPLEPRGRRGLEIGKLQGGREGVGSAEKTTEDVDTAQVNMRDVGQESRNLRNVIDVDKGVRVSHQFPIFKQSPAAGAKDQDSMMRPQGRDMLEVVAPLPKLLGDERCQPAGEEPPSTRSEALL